MTSGWARAQNIAQQALAGAVFEPVGTATHFHADYVVPYWADSLAKIAVQGAHIFYRWPGWWGQPAAFAKRHSGEEPDPRLLRNAALRRYGVRPEPPEWEAKDLILAADPRVELISIVHLLAAGPEPKTDATSYEKDVRKHFGSHTNHVAVEIYRQLSEANSNLTIEAAVQTLMHYSQPPKLVPEEILGRDLVRAVGGKRKLEGFISALRDFVKHSEFESFYSERKAFFAEIEQRAREPASILVAGVEEETGAPIHRARFILAPLLQVSGVAGCHAPPKRPRKAWVLVGVTNPSKSFDRLAEVRQVLDSLSESECMASSSRVALAGQEGQRSRRG